MNEVASDVAAARHLAAARDRDLTDLSVKVDDLERKVDTGFAQVDRGFAEVRGKLDQAAAGQQQIAELLNTLIAQQVDQ